MIPAVSLLMSPDNADLIIKVSNDCGIFNFESVAGRDLNIKSAISIQSLFNGIECKSFFVNDESVEYYSSLLIKRINELYNKYKCKNYVFGSPKFRNINNTDDELRAFYFFRKVCENIPTDAILSIENNPREYGTNFATDFLQCVNVVNKIDMPNFKINLDLGGFFKSNDKLDDVLKHTNMINHIHISRFNLLPISDLSNEEINLYKNIVSQINKVYNGTISLEVNIKQGITEDFIKKEIYSFKEIIGI
ncbi:MAG: hypothetical protein HUJ68_11865 [Clostridia bacterium]|nr:hypothetical protein [Clostridia bacterium]